MLELATAAYSGLVLKSEDDRAGTLQLTQAGGEGRMTGPEQG